ncbi:hypothetical protein CC85DRAFT_287221 [Cutaneotrichosporon oleaginosum]|uniref:Uncharacterized protein n=1 Tax=Cutaneotrichosporon oleaginosum TaxID=879819 RepID=A0A0J0XHV3_9TREE|nr:uncharacterized protein CC85DRAFT_287221 [Cutaneotrichosporon oleaginosum]KLT40705.1 hypothetical protein CC85DRAFT_287221 [Cutaneotrichosporon oleaginosum]TXT14245.1 hypothetical protein COLE_00438 [Cutaneotrichosporon oleaginosum]
MSLQRVCKLQAASYKLQTASCKLRGYNCHLRHADSRSEELFHMTIELSQCLT